MYMIMPAVPTKTIDVVDFDGITESGEPDQAHNDYKYKMLITYLYINK